MIFHRLLARRFVPWKRDCRGIAAAGRGRHHAGLAEPARTGSRDHRRSNSDDLLARMRAGP